jgi:hypothetical protein
MILVVGCGNCSNVAGNMVVLATILVLVAVVSIVLHRLVIVEIAVKLFEAVVPVAVLHVV